MTIEMAAGLAILVTAVIAGIWYWNERVRRVPLAEFGMDDVARVLKWEPEAVRRSILDRGWMTSQEWMNMNERQAHAIDEELRRRGDAKRSSGDGAPGADDDVPLEPSRRTTSPQARKSKP